MICCIALGYGFISTSFRDENIPVGKAALFHSYFIVFEQELKGKCFIARKVMETREPGDSAVLSAVEAILQIVLPSRHDSAQ